MWAADVPAAIYIYIFIYVAHNIYIYLHYTLLTVSEEPLCSDLLMEAQSRRPPVLFCTTMLCCTTVVHIAEYFILYCTRKCYTRLDYTTTLQILAYTVLDYIKKCTILSYTALYNTILYYAILHSIEHTVLHYTGLY